MQVTVSKGSLGGIWLELSAPSPQCPLQPSISGSATHGLWCQDGLPCFQSLLLERGVCVGRRGGSGGLQTSQSFVASCPLPADLPQRRRSAA